MVSRTDTTVGMTCEVVNIKGANGDTINAYVARPTGNGPFPGVVFAHHIFGWDEWSWEITRRLAQHGYATIMPNLYFRAGHGTPEEVGTKIRAEGGVADSTVVGDIAGSIGYLRAQSYSNGKVAVMGPCSGGRHAFLAGCELGSQVDAVVELWGGGVIQAETTPQRPVSPITLTSGLTGSLLGIFGNDDGNPSPAQVDEHEAALKAAGKDYEFHRYDGAGHGFFYYDRPMYRQEQAADGWAKVWDFLERKLS
ncbi:MAG: dienelactone hydrolase family protein [Chloroflexota bacterium]